MNHWVLPFFSTVGDRYSHIDCTAEGDSVVEGNESIAGSSDAHGDGSLGEWEALKIIGQEMMDGQLHYSVA